MMLQELPDLKPERIVGDVGILRRAKENQHERLALVDHLALGIFLQKSRKIIDFFFERGLSIYVRKHNILIDPTQLRNQLERRAQAGPRGKQIACVVSNVLVVSAERSCAVRNIFLDELLAVEDATYIVGEVTDDGIDAERFHPGDVLLDHAGIAAVITAANTLPVRRLEQGHSGATLKGYGVWTEPRFVLHYDNVAVLVHNQRGARL